MQNAPQNHPKSVSRESGFQIAKSVSRNPALAGNDVRFADQYFSSLLVISEKDKGYLQLHELETWNLPQVTT